MKGVYYRANVSGFDPIPDVTDRIWDVADYVVPAEVKFLHFVIFLMTLPILPAWTNFNFQRKAQQFYYDQ